MGLAALVPTSNFKKEKGRDFRGGYTLILGQANTASIQTAWLVWSYSQLAVVNEKRQLSWN